MPAPNDYFTILTAAVSDMAANGFDSAERVAYWQRKLRDAAESFVTSEAELERMLKAALQGVYDRMVNRGEVVRYHPGVGRFTIDRLTPVMRQELDRRILAAADLIRLNRKQSIDQTLRRFAGWSTSIPKGGTRTLDRVKQKQDIRKSLSQLPFEARRVIIDQGHKLTSAINEIVATDGGAIAAVWHSKWRMRGYVNYRQEHKERDQKVYAIRGSWAMKGGLMTRCDGYTDEMTKPAEEPFCSCSYEYLYNLRQLPEGTLTAKGKLALSMAREMVHSM